MKSLPSPISESQGPIVLPLMLVFFAAEAGTASVLLTFTLVISCAIAAAIVRLTIIGIRVFIFKKGVYVQIFLLVSSIGLLVVEFLRSELCEANRTPPAARVEKEIAFDTI